jgi:GAF domain-containing protein
LGKLVAHKSQDQIAWTQQETSMLETLAEQLERALESAHLYEVTQQRAILEQTTREITANIRAAVSVEDAVRRAIYELANVLSASELVTRIGTERVLISDRGGQSYE